jgi:hypothetical protein
MEGSLLFAPSNGSTEDPESVWRLKEKVLNLKKSTLIVHQKKAIAEQTRHL